MRGIGSVLAALLAVGTVSAAEETETLTLKRAVALALQNSPELAFSRAQQRVAEGSARVSRAELGPNLYTGSGLLYSSGIPQTPGGTAPAVLNVAYVQTLFSAPLQGHKRAAEARAAGAYGVEGAREAVTVRTASAYLDVLRARRELALLHAEAESAARIVEATHERAEAGFELPAEALRAELAAARIEERVVALQGREDSRADELASLTGLSRDAVVNLAPEEMSADSPLPVDALVARALATSPAVKEAEAERRAREYRLDGERGSYRPSLDLIGEYSMLSRINNYDEFFNHYQKHNVNIGLLVKVPLFSSHAGAAAALALSELHAAELELASRRSELALAVRQAAHRGLELASAASVARLELELARENRRVVEARLEEGRASLRDLERARVEAGEKEIAFLDAAHDRELADLELARATGRIARFFPEAETPLGSMSNREANGLLTGAPPAP